METDKQVTDDLAMTAETARLIREMDGLIERARILIHDRQKLVAIITEQAKKPEEK
ncbi:MAG: hypothetical protein QOD26_2943 [Betaproteobacteria bacterium]|jgi:hypothetical protein|nr:hypothetical protein [Betaproteobacteria bacterium]